MSESQQSEQAKSKRIELILQQLNMLPTLPAVAARLLQVTVRSNSQASEVVRLIESDASLASKIVSMATRGGTGLKRQAVSVSKAVVLLGFDAVRNAVLSIKVFETLCDSDENRQSELDPRGLWKFSLAVGCGAKLLAEKIDRHIDPEEAFLCGLLHNMGKLALLAALPKSYARVVQITENTLADIADIEQRVLGVDHCIAGKRLAERWQLPEAVVETVWLYQEGLGTLPEAVKNRRLVEIVHVAEALARQQRLGYSGNHRIGENAADLAEQLGCDRNTFEKISLQLCESISERAMMVGIDAVEPASLYHEALGEANSELARLNNRLQNQNRQLQLRSCYFALLNQLSEGLSNCRTVQNTCDLIAGIWQRHIGGRACAVTALSADGSIFEGVVKKSADEGATPFVIDNDDEVQCFTDLIHQNTAGFVVRTCGTEEASLLDMISGDFPVEESLVMPLLSGDQVIGLLFWVGDAENADYSSQIKELQGFSNGVGLAITRSQRTEQQSLLCEQLARVNRQLRSSQAELAQKQSMASVGEMACGAAHEMNNPLAVIVGRAQLLASTEEDGKRKKMLDAISERGAELSDIISGMLEFAKPEVPNPSPVDLSGFVSNCVTSHSERAEQAKAAIAVDVSDSLPAVYVDRGQMVEVVGEILKNSIESFGEKGGRIEISASYNEWDDTVILKITDNGCGMDAETLSKARDPFFSAKKAGRKRGLGLSRSNRLVEGVHGRMTITSETGKGTTVLLALPAHDESKTPDHDNAGQKVSSL
ncbi:MAG: HDOD domain-containing protein [Sedimentisphaerales bacterium]|nr:HDOD domain-containing protein [Sedimentisphaerales bacterium]